MAEKDSDEVNTTENTARGHADERGSGLSERKTTRRSLIKGIGVTGLSLPFLSNRASAHHTVKDDYRTVINVADEGADLDGEESITDLLYDVRQDDALLYFPHGRYKMDSRFRYTSFENFGMLGDYATFVPAPMDEFEDRGGAYWLFRLGTGEHPGGKLLFKNFNVDQTAARTGVRALDAVVEDRLEVRNVDVHGIDDLGSEGPARLGITDPSGTGVVENFWALDGSLPPREMPNRENMYMGTTGIMANWPNRGELTFRNCRLYGFSGTGLYACDGAGDTGRVVVDHGVFKNNGVAQLRIGQNDSTIEDVYVSVDEYRPEFGQQRGIRVENAAGTTRIRDTDIDIYEPNGHALNVQEKAENVRIRRLDLTVRGDRKNHGIVLYDDLQEGIIDESVVDIDTPGGFGIWVHESDHDGTVVVEQTKVTGSAGTESAISGIRCDRDGTELRQLLVDQTGDDESRIGIEALGDDMLIYDVTAKARNYPLVQYGDSGWLEQIYAESYGSEEGVVFDDSCSDTLIKHSTVVNGIRDDSDDLRSWAISTN